MRKILQADSSASRALVAIATLTALVAACTSDADPGAPSTSGAADDDAGVTLPAVDAGGDATTPPTVDAAPPTNDAGVPPTDAGTPPATDAASEAAAPEVTSRVGPTGSITVWPDALFAYFFEDDTIVHFASAPTCVLHVRSATKGYSSAGDLRIAGDYFGKSGGPPAGGMTFHPGVAPDATPNAYEEILPLLLPDPTITFFPDTGALAVLVATVGTATVPAIPVQTLTTPAYESIEVSSPKLPDAGELGIPHDRPFEVTWKVPTTGSPATQRMIVSFRDMATVSHVGDLRCGFPLAAGKAEVPASVLTEAYTRLGASTSAPLNGTGLRILAGDQRELTIGDASYVLELGRHDGTTFGDEVQVQIK